MTYADIAWKKAEPVYQSMINHPFNVELAKGVLDPKIYDYYIEQDLLFLTDFRRCLSLLASKLECPQHVTDFINFAHDTVTAEQNIIHNAHINNSNYRPTNKLAPATICFNNYLMRHCSVGTTESAIATVMPCIQIYREVGLHLAKYSVPNNPYKTWIDTYSSDEFSIGADKAIAVYNDVAERASETQRELMLECFQMVALLEWHFWNDAYNMTRFDDIS